ncbi:MBL fold metallo-hydrolase [Frankia sp. AgPm24]|uniref:MBL fold metallo-hydrolase n=1 Tax=Frankia umida TaxID=573489 RepID=A0ABT0K3C4_9ACTN|nr:MULTISPECIES: MBL fold metallo-hydrolase [Frankia]MCK9878303.1 MBL fold metallo-hydrolase [Frankia umida]MCK9921733.1 MBL fold metallo-hydrolase [Frankia sp. AgPm24]
MISLVKARWPNGSIPHGRIGTRRTGLGGDVVEGYDISGTRALPEWAEPNVEQVEPGVHRIPLPLPNDGLRAVNVYAIEQPDGLVLIDAGWSVPESEQRLEAALGKLGAGLGDIQRFLVTHIHRDHYTQAVVLRRRFGMRVALGLGEQPALDRFMNRPRAESREIQHRQLIRLGAAELATELMRFFLEQLVRDDSTDDWAVPDEWLDAPVDVQLDGITLRAVPTPGHTRGHVVFHNEASRLLFAGDHVLPTITPSIGLTADPGPLPLGAFLDSLRLVRSMPDARLLPAHGPVTDSAHARIDQLLAHHATRLDVAEDAVRVGADTAFAVARAMTWTRREHAFDDLDMFNRMLAVTETAAHLDLLVAQGRLRAGEVDDVLYYALP